MRRFPLKVHCFPHKLNWLGRFEGCYNVKVHTSYFEQINLHFSTALCDTAWSLYFKFASYAYDVYLVSCKDSEAEGVTLCSVSIWGRERVSA